MEIKGNTRVDFIQNKDNKDITPEQRAVASYFDKDNNGIIDANEASVFNASKVVLEANKVRIISPTGEVQEYEDLAKARSNEYYESGSIPVAVIDVFSGPDNQGGAAAHGNGVANLIKKNNPDISLSRFDSSPTRCFTQEQKDFVAKCEQNPALEKEMGKTPEGRAFLDKLFPPETYIKPYNSALDEIKQKMDTGKQYRAVNLSSAFECSYDDLNQICEKELGCKITPENVAQYRTQIKDILSSKAASGELKTINCARSGKSVDINLIVSIMDKIEDLNIPIYVAQGYKSKDETEQTVNLFSLPQNARAVEGGTTFGGKIQSPRSSTNSLAVDSKTGKRRIEDSLAFWLGDFSRNSTSFATPIATAKSLNIEG